MSSGTRFIILYLVLFAGFVLASAPSVACTNSGGAIISDPPGDISTPCAIALAQSINERATYGDTDAFRFTATKGIQYRIHALVLEYSEFTVSLKVIDQNGRTVADGIQSNRNSLIGPFTPTYTGNYYVVVSATGFPYKDSSGYYILAYTTTNPSPICAAGTQPGPLRGQSVSGSLSRAGTSPRYCFGVAQGSYHRFRLYQNGNENGGFVGYKIYGQQMNIRSSGRIYNVEISKGGSLDVAYPVSSGRATSGM